MWERLLFPGSCNGDIRSLNLSKLKCSCGEGCAPFTLLQRPSELTSHGGIQALRIFWERRLRITSKAAPPLAAGLPVCQDGRGWEPGLRQQARAVMAPVPHNTFLPSKLRPRGRAASPRKHLCSPTELLGGAPCTSISPS